MSRLYYSEDGRVMPSLCEELTTFRRARKTLALPATDAPGRVYILARPYPDNERAASGGPERRRGGGARARQARRVFLV